jgi:hypothetical protein
MHVAGIFAIVEAFVQLNTMASNSCSPSDHLICTVIGMHMALPALVASQALHLLCCCTCLQEQLHI